MKNKKKSVVFTVILSLILLGSIGVVLNSKYSSQNKRISELNNKVSELGKMQLPQRQFDNYEDCLNNGGVDLWTINVQFTGCLGGEAFPENRGGDGYVYQAQAFFQYSAQNLPRLEENKVNKSGKNIVLAGIPASTDLTQFLENDYSGCETGTAESKFAPAYFKLKKEVQNRFALVGYGCANDKLLDKTFSIAIKLADGWRWISTTNNMDEKGRPSCLVVDMFKISKNLAPKCFENTGYNNGKLKDVTYP